MHGISFESEGQPNDTRGSQANPRRDEGVEYLALGGHAWQFGQESVGGPGGRGALYYFLFLPGWQTLHLATESLLLLLRWEITWLFSIAMGIEFHYTNSSLSRRLGFTSHLPALSLRFERRKEQS